MNLAQKKKDWKGYLRDKINGIEAYDYSGTTEEIITFIECLLREQEKEYERKTRKLIGVCITNKRRAEELCNYKNSDIPIPTVTI